MGTVHENHYTFLHWVLLGMRSLSDQSCGWNQNTHFVSDNFFFKKHSICEIIWKNIVEPSRPQMTVRCMRIASWITKATNTRSEYIILLFHRNSGCKYAPHCYIIRTLPVVFNIVLFFMYRLSTIFVLMWSLFIVWLLIVFTQAYYVLYIPCQCAVRFDKSEISVCIYVYVCIYVGEQCTHSFVGRPQGKRSLGRPG